MIPMGRLSSELIYAPLILPNPEPEDTVSLEFGGVEIGDSSQGLDIKVWTATVTDTGVVVTAEGSTPYPIALGTDITEISLAFDQNMRPSIAYVQAGAPKFYWYDSFVEQYVITDLDPDVEHPKCTLDDHRLMEAQSSDIILTYIRDGNLYFRVQRERFLNEHLLYADINTIIPSPVVASVGMNMVGRLQWDIRGNFYGG